MNNMHYYIYRKIFSSIRFWFYFLFIFILAARITWIYKDTRTIGTTIEQSANIPMAIYTSLTSFYIVIFIYIPLFLLSVEIVSNFYNRYKILIAYKSRNRWWLDKIVVIFILSCIFTITINGAIIGSILLSGNGINISFTFLLFIFLGIELQVLGFLILGIISCLLTFIFRSVYVGFCVTFSGVFIVKMLIKGAKLQLFSIEDYMFLIDKSSNEIFMVTPSDSIISSFFIILLLFTFLLGKRIVKKKDIFWSD